MSLRKKNKKSTYEDDLDRYRCSRDWNSALNSVKKVAKYSSDTASTAILEWIVTAEIIVETKKDVQEAKNLIAKALEKDPENEEAIALLGRIEFNEGDEKTAFSTLSKLKGFAEKSPLNYSLHQLQLILDALLKKGICYEHNDSVSSAVATYNELIDFAQRYFDGTLNDPECRLTMEKASYHTAVLYLGQGNVVKSVENFRKCYALSGPSSSLLHKLHKHLGKLLQRHVSSDLYGQLPQEVYGGIYAPQDEVEESLLLLLLLEESALANPQQRNEEIELYDELAIGYGKRGAWREYVVALERLLSVRFDDSHFWFNFGSSLLSAKKYKRALFVFKLCIKMDPTNVLTFLLAAKLCINHLPPFLEEAVTFCQQAIHLIEQGSSSNSSSNSSGSSSSSVKSSDRFLLPKLHHMLGVANSKLANKVHSNAQRKELQQLALQHLTTAHFAAKRDYLVAFHLALQYAEVREVDLAFAALKKSLDLHRGHADSWLLLALLLSSQKQYEEALAACKAALAETREASLLITKAKLELLLGSEADALETCKEAFTLWKAVEQQQALALDEDSDNEDRKTVLSSARESSMETDSQDHKSIIYTHAMSVYSDGGTAASKDKEDFSSRVELWLAVADLFCELKQYKDAQLCTQQAKNLAPLSPDGFFQEGKIEEAQGRLEEATMNYQKALTIDSTHKQSLIHLSFLYFKNEKHLLAEKFLTSILRNDDTSHEAWYNLGKILQEKGDVEKASECFITAIELERTSPVIPYYKIKKQL